MIGPRLKVLWHWITMGPYHFARMRALARVPGDHEWVRSEEEQDIALLTLARSVQPPSARQAALARILNERQPDVVISSGYAEAHLLRIMLGYRNLNPTSLLILWSESTAMDRSRVWLKEAIKSLFVSAFDGAIVAGRPHASYLERLGMPADKIQIAGNCVDNEFFSVRTDALRQNGNTVLGSGLPRAFFLFVGRMISEKNVSGLIEAYRRYRRFDASSPLELVLVGAGPEETSLRRQVDEARIPGVRFAGQRQADELPEFYARARCLILPSVSEPWGLVVNEAMASGIPVLASNQCGCVADLLRDGVNGFVFDPEDHDHLAELLLKLSDGTASVERLGVEGRRMIAEYTPALFGQRAAAHFRLLHQRKTKHPHPQARWQLSDVKCRSAGFLARLLEELS